MGVEFDLLGEVQARIDGHPIDLGHARQRCVLVALLVDSGVSVPPDRLLDRVWGDDLPQRARGTVYSYLSRLRRVLDPADDVEIVRRAGGYVVLVDPSSVDLHAFRHLVVQAASVDSDERAADLLEEALRLWRGEAFGQLDTPWLSGVREALARERLAAELDRNDHVLALGRHAEHVAHLAEAVAANELDERLAGQLMLALYRCGRATAALDVFQRLSRRLGSELGIDPGAALRALQNQILRADPALDSAQQLRSRSPVRIARVTVPRQLPAAPRLFTGRARDLAALDDAIRSNPDDRSVAMVTIEGSGGIGKTWLAVRWAYDNLARFPDGQLYLNLRGFDPASEPLTSAVAVRALLDSLGVDPGSIPVDLDAQSGLYRSLVADKRMLILLDNARSTAQVAPLLPGSPSCTVLVTSRHNLLDLSTAHGARPVPVDVLPSGDGRALLSRHLGDERLAAEPDAATALLEHCDGLPLALGIMAARAASQPDFPLGELANELQDASTRLDALDAGDLAASLRGVLTCSYDALPAPAAHVFALVGLAPGPDLGLQATAALTDLAPGRVRTLLRRLVSAHLVQQHEPGRYRMHDLVRLFAIEMAQVQATEDERRAALRRVLDAYLHAAYRAATLLSPYREPIRLVAVCEAVQLADITDYESALSWFTLERPNVIAAIDRAVQAGLDVHAWQLDRTLSIFASRRGLWREDVPVHLIALAAAERLGDRAAQAGAHRTLATADGVVGDYDRAHAHLREALRLVDDLQDPAEQAQTHLQLSIVLSWQQRPRESLEHSQRALELYGVTGNRHGQATALNGHGWIHVQLGHFEEAMNYCHQALLLYQEVGYRHGEANTWDSLGFAHHHLDQHDDAIASYERALEIFRAEGSRHREAETLVRLGETYDASGDVALAVATWGRALTILDELGHRDADGVRARLAGRSTS